MIEPLRGLRKDIFYALFIFSFFNRDPFFHCMINLIMRQRSSLDRICEIHSRIFPHRSHTQAHAIHASRYTRCAQTLPEVYSTEYPSRRCVGQKEKREGGRGTATEREVDGGRGGGGGSSTSSTWRNQHTRAHSHTRSHAHVRAGRLLMRIAPVTSSFRPLSRALGAFRKSFERAAKFRRIRRRAWITWIISVANITPAILPRIMRSLVVAASKFNVATD